MSKCRCLPNLTGFALAASLFWLGMDCAGAAPASVTLVGRELNVSGTMDADMLSQLKEQNWSAVDVIRFSSAGGRVEYSVDIAKILAQSNKPITIHDVCASACADVLVIEGRVVLEPDTIVLLGNTPTAQALTMHDYPAISKFLADLGQTEQAWLKANEVDTRLLLLSVSATLPVCVYAPTDDAKAANRMTTLHKFDAWAPRSETLAGLGVHAALNWHQDASSVVLNLQARYPKADLARIRLADEPVVPSAETMSAFLSAVPVCKIVQVPPRTP